LAQEVEVGTILISGWPQQFGFESEPYSGRWSVVKVLDGFALDHKIRAAGWNLFFIASEVKVMFFGGPTASKIQHAVKRILGRVTQHHFNGLEVTGIVTKRFFGLPYAVVSAHSRHLQQSCRLDDAEVRRLSRREFSSDAA
jgi:hypothetical protein